MPVTVHNLSQRKPPGVCEYIGRPRTLGNRFVIGVHGNRDECIGQYRNWLWAEIKTKTGPVYEKVVSLARQSRTEEVRLLCHCKPKACHGDVIKSCIEWMIKEGKC